MLFNFYNNYNLRNCIVLTGCKNIVKARICKIKITVNYDFQSNLHKQQNPINQEHEY